ncbi:MAG: YdiU family protein [Microthrixaceae bacterium]
MKPQAPLTGSKLLELQHVFHEQLPELSLEWQAAAVPEPALVVLNEALARELGIDPSELNSPAAVDVFSGNHAPEGSVPVALGYAGHQFGNYSPRLGDGRALLLGELTTPDGDLVDIHLKGSGRTPFARGGDGKATIGPMLREYIVSEALSSLGVATTRSLAVVTTGEQINRDRLEPGAVLTRIAASHIRVGTFEYAVRLGGSDLVRRLADHAIERHYPHLATAENPYVELLSAVVDAQAKLIAQWMLLGFIHGVMNTDNMTISGEGIDYGPCAFMDQYDPGAVFSSIDHAGRYAYGNQAPIAAWNLARLAETMLDLLAADTTDAVASATEIVNGFPARFNLHWRGLINRKLGLAELSDDSLLDDLPVAMQADGLDWTQTFRNLADGLRGSFERPEFGGQLGVWVNRWHRQIEREGRDSQQVADEMDSVNPIYIPRNHLVDEALQAATSGDLGPFRQLVNVLSDPFTKRAGLDRFANAATSEFNAGFQTFCGT